MHKLRIVHRNDPSQRQRILIVRLSAIGDCIHGLPVACAIRDFLPTAHISWVVEGRPADFLRGHPAIDQVIQVKRKWLKSPRAIWNLRRELRTLRPDVAIDLQGLSKSAIVARLSKAPLRIGFDGIDGREISRWLNNRLVTPTATHVIDRTLQLLGPLGIDNPQVRFGLPEFAPEELGIARYLHDRGLGHGFALLNPGAGWASKRWPLDRFAEVARYLGTRHQLRSVIAWAGAEERVWADQIIATSGGHAHLAPQTTLRELALLARRASFFVGSDTGPLHLAAAAGTACIGMYGPMSAERNGPYGSQHIALQNVCLQGTSRSKRTADNASMRAISVAEVCRACDTMLARAKQSDSRNSKRNDVIEGLFAAERRDAIAA